MNWSRDALRNMCGTHLSCIRKRDGLPIVMQGSSRIIIRLEDTAWKMLSVYLAGVIERGDALDSVLVQDGTNHYLPKEGEGR